MPQDVLERAFDAVLKEEIRKLNTHLPRNRKTLEKLLIEDEPHVEAIDGSRIPFKKKELAELARIVPKKFHKNIHLPFLILRRMDLGKSIYAVSGSKIEEFTIKKMLELTTLPFEEFEKDKEVLYLYKPYVSQLIRGFHSLVVIGFGVPEELRSQI
jgi:hypothetical protein